MYLYKHQVEYYEKTVYEILEKGIGLILPKFWRKRKEYKTDMTEKTNNISLS